jgi:hypothetical protein
MKTTNDGSRSLSFGSYEMRKVVKGFLIALTGSALAYLTTDVIPLFEDTSYYLLIPVMSVIVNAVRQLLKNNAG